MVDGDNCYAAHRLSYTVNIGPIPEGIFVCHACDNRKCVNPEHLWLGNQTDNMADMVAKGRASIMLGEDNPNSTLTSEDVKQIRAASRKGSTAKELGEKYGVDPMHVRRICAYKYWAHIR
jgi:Autographiviridae endonuclease